MPISNYTTKIASMKTIAEIQQILLEHDADKVMIENKDRVPVGITFQIQMPNGFVSFKLPVNWEGVLNAMKKDAKVPKAFQNKDQALRVAWRIIRDWVEAQMAMVEAEQASMEQVFLPYALLQNGNTVFDEFNPDRLLKLR